MLSWEAAYILYRITENHLTSQGVSTSVNSKYHNTELLLHTKNHIGPAILIFKKKRVVLESMHGCNI